MKTIEVLFEDDYFIACNKPAGMLVIPSPKQETNTLTEVLNRQQAATGLRSRLMPCHRLDRDTSGVILFAKGKASQKRLMDEFKKQAVKKDYLVVVQGRIPKKRGEIKMHTAHLKSHRFAARRSSGKPAVTRYEVLQQKQGIALIRAMPLTGRTNQIRIHFQQLGYPVLGDRKYGIGRLFKLRFRRTALHAFRIQFHHPFTGARVKVSAPLPDDMCRLLGAIGISLNSVK